MVDPLDEPDLIDSAPVSMADGAESPSTVRSRLDRRRAALGGIVVALVLTAAVAAIYRQRHSFVDALDAMGAGALVGSAGIALVATAFTYPVWREVLLGLDVDMPWFAGARVFFVSQLGKYLPGSVWPVVIQMEAGRARGASRRTMLAANLITLVLSCAVGLVIASVVLPFSDAHALRRYWVLLVALPFLLALLHPRAVPWMLDRAFAMVHREPLGQRLHVRDSLRAAGWSGASFAAQGLHVAVLALAVGEGGGAHTVLLALGGMALAVCAGVLFIPAPAGAGVRDVILTLVLSTTLTNAQALAVVVASRMILIVVDVVLAALVVLFVRNAPDAKVP